ncbi:type 1 glutamine amidotransferase, partial [Candidatus Fermentibacterales bacterium]|nr:type 1 glutamine amidotransferase [Candidatus Fermentibacterales bacterium]
SVHVGRWLPDGVEMDIRLILDREPMPAPDCYDRLIHTGSALSVVDDAHFYACAFRLIHRASELSIPQLGICYGHQLLCRALLGKDAVERSHNGLEAGWREISVSDTGLRMLCPDAPAGSRRVVRVFQSHRDRVVRVPDTAEVIAWNDHTAIQAFCDPALSLLGVQFHPEFDLDSGNREFAADRENLESSGYSLEEITSSGPEGFSAAAFFGRFALGDPVSSLGTPQGASGS